MHNSGFMCPVCGFRGLNEPAYDVKGCASFEICPSCATEFGNHDAKRSHEELRKAWLAVGAPWRSKALSAPLGWDGHEQLKEAGLIK